MGARILPLLLGAQLGGAFLVTGGCASARYERFERLPEAEKARYARYRHFMTERQRARFLALETQAERDAFIASMHVEERLARYPAFIREAIWAEEVVPGMDRDAVLLSWGPPDRIERRPDPFGKGLPAKETWSYGGRRTVVFLEGKVREVTP